MRLPPRENTREYYLRLLDTVIERRFVKQVHVGGAQACAALPGDPPVKVDECARVKIMLQGAQQHAISRAGARIDFQLRPGQGLFWSPHAWTMPHYDRPCSFMGIVYRRGFLRVLVASVRDGGRAAASTTHFYHTTLAAGAVSQHVIAALAELAERPIDVMTELHLFEALLRLAREHLRADSAELNRPTRAQQSWRRVQEYLHQNYAEPITRESVAAALDLHPNYLSTLCSQVGGNPFHTTLETIRLDRARRLLRQSELTMGRVAQLCGYASTNYFIKAFRRVVKTTPGYYRSNRAH